MARQPLNEHFLRTSFLSGANAAYVEAMQSEYERNPGAVSDEWRHFFESLNEDRDLPARSPRSDLGRAGAGAREQRRAHRRAHR